MDVATSDERETTFQEMDAGWQRIISRSSMQRPDVTAWEADIVRFSSEQDELLRTGRWVLGVDDILTIVGRARYEAHHSAMLAWLLDPLGKHGLGTTFLEGILRHCGVTGARALRYARPELEVQRSGTRADIVVFAPDVTLIVENKVDAGEQERQCDRLYEHFGDDPGAVFVFLTPTGRAPHTATGATRSAWALLSYPTLATLIDEALRRESTNAAAAGLSAAKNYLLTIRRQFT